MSVSIQPEILSILDRGRAEGVLFFLPPQQLDLKTYEQVNKVLDALGGRWDRKSRAHVFSEPVEEAIAKMMATGEVTRHKQELGFFETPPDVADLIIAHANILPGMSVLEPSAGRGALLGRMAMRSAEVAAVEIDAGRAEYLRSTFPAVITTNTDFLRLDVQFPVDRVVMNPPFSVPGNAQADLDHVWQAFKWLKPGGRLVSILGASVRFRENRKTMDFREWVERFEGVFYDLPEGAFKSSGTGVQTCFLVIDKPEAAQ